MQKPGSSGLNVRLWRFSSLATAQQYSSSPTLPFLFMQCAGSGPLVFSAFRQNPCLDHVVCFGLLVFAGACHVWVGDAIRRHSQGSLRSKVRRVVVVVVVVAAQDFCRSA